MIISHNALADLRADVGAASIALRFGSYDLLHAGHQAGIDFAAATADVLVLGVMPDAYITRTKGPDRPINPEAARVEAIDAARGVAYSFVAPAETVALAGLFVSLRPNVYVEELARRERRLKMLFLGTLGIKYVVDNQPRILSTTSMVDRLGLNEAKARSSLDFRL